MGKENFLKREQFKTITYDFVFNSFNYFSTAKFTEEIHAKIHVTGRVNIKMNFVVSLVFYVCAPFDFAPKLSTRLTS